MFGETWQIAVLTVVAIGLLSLAAWILIGYRTSPEKRERMRRAILARKGRLTDGHITEASIESIYYSYSVAGVQYSTAQDIRSLYEYLPADPERLVGHIWVKYMTTNPANSIVVAERWSGLNQQLTNRSR